MKPQISHPMIAHKKKTTELAPDVPVHTIMPAEDEVMFDKQMQAAESDYGDLLSNTISHENPQAVDAILDREMKKRDIFNKLVLFKEDHYQEVSVAGLTFRLRILNSIDNSFIMKEVKKEPADEQLASMSLLILAASIVDVNGLKFEEFYSGPKEIEHPTLKKYYELRQWQRPVVNVLQKAYNDFQVSVEKGYSKDFLG